MLIETAYVAVSCNPKPDAVQWGRNDLVCYAACNAVLILDTQIGGGKVVHTLSAHRSRVNVVRWIENTENEHELVSGCSAGLVIVWSLNSKTGEFVPQRLDQHKCNVNAVDAVYKGGDTFVLSASMDNTILIWNRHNDKAEFTVQQNIDLKYGIGMSIKFSLLPTTDDLMFCVGMEDSSMRFYIYTSESECYENKLSLLKNEDWIQGFDFKLDKSSGELLLATASQDHSVIIWHIKTSTDDSGSCHTNPYMLTTNLITNRLDTGQVAFDVGAATILHGHEGWVYSARWHPNPDKMQLLTASIDKSVILWEFNAGAKMWLESMRLGEVGGNTLGFYGAMFSPDGTSILAYSYHGAFHMWKSNDLTDTWDPMVTVGGHFANVTDVAWSPDGDYICSVSADMTTRVHVPWKPYDTITWHEIARPQLHGHAMTCLALTGEYSIVSGAEEKIFRAFVAPENFRKNFRQICELFDKANDDEEEACPKGASVPSLGLSNKAIFKQNNDDIVVHKKNAFPEESHFVAVDMFEPPTEEDLIQNTLWPETRKLYGHGYEVFAVAATPDRKFIASSCKSNNSEHASIIIWDTKTCSIQQKLFAHNLTVVQLEFSPDSQMLLSVSRDRKWTVFKRVDDNFVCCSTTDKKSPYYHTRIIWCCSWSHDSQYFVTGSRDGKAVVWEHNPETSPTQCKHRAASDILNLPKESVTAVCFAPGFVNGSYLVAIGLEMGQIFIYNWSKSGWQLQCLLDTNRAHSLTVNRLRFRPIFGRCGDKFENTQNVLQLVSCSADYSLRVFDISF